MSLRTRVLLASTTIVVVGTVLAVVIGSWVVLRGFGDLEQAAAVRDLERAEAAIDSDLDNLSSLVRDWSNWNDTLAFVTDPAAYEPYLTSNLQPDTLVGVGLNLLAITDGDGEVAWAGAVDLDTEEFVQAGPLVDRLREAGLLAAFDDLTEHRTGLLLVDERLLSLSVQPITDSEGETPPTGTLTMARWLDQPVLAGLADRTRLDLALDTTAPAFVGTRVETTEGTITSATTLRDVTGAPVAVLSVTEPRSILAQGRSSVRLMVGVVLGVLVLSGAALLAVADRRVLRRLRRLGREVEGIGRRRDGSARVSTDPYHDEISELATALNEGLAALERVQQDLQLRNVELAQTNRELAAANRERQRFLSAVSHDLRTPLTSIKGFVGLLDQRWDDLAVEQRRSFLARIEDGVGTIDAMVDDLLTLSRLERGAVIATPVRLALDEHLPRLVEELSIAGVEVLAAEGVVEVDADHVRRIVANLLDNARKYGAAPIHLSAQVVGDVVELRVRDHGLGIDPSFEASLFEAFSQAQPTEDAHAGVGLGLSIVQHLALQNGGSVTYDPTVRPGACFVVRLPAVADAPDDAAAGVPAALPVAD